LKFVDEPKAATADAERLLRETIDELFDRLRDQCDAIGADPKHKHASTEQLRERFGRYEALLAQLGVQTQEVG
jgi:ABC-type transporter MlaC component